LRCAVRRSTCVALSVSDLTRARDELRVAVGPSIAALIDWDTLALESTELADEALDVRIADLRFTARLAGMPVQLDLVFEHQGRSDPWMPVRMFCHAGAIWNAVRRERRPGRARSKAKVPLVLSIVLHNGRRRWSASREIEDVIDGWRSSASAHRTCFPGFPS
jgi:hypothetical protein